MHMIRGALAFLTIVVIAVIVESSGSRTSDADAATRSGMLTTTPIACSDATTADQLCPVPCIIFADVYTANNDRASLPGKVWVLPGQEVIWQGREDNDTRKKVKLARVHFEDPFNPGHPKSTATILAEAKLDTATDTFHKTMTDGSPCV